MKKRKKTRATKPFVGWSYSSELVSRAEVGESTAEFSLGLCYALGKGVEQNDKMAVKWYQRAAEVGDPFAQLKLGLCYLRGKGIEKSESRAFSYFFSAAVQHNEDAQYYLGACYEHGIGVAESSKEAFWSYGDAADKGHPLAQYCLGRCYDRGIGVDKDPREAVRLYLLAARNEIAEAQFRLCVCYFYGNGTDIDYESCALWCDEAAKQNHIAAQYNLGLLYRTGKGVAQCENTALHWIQKAARAGYPAAEFALGAYCYSYGGLNPDSYPGDFHEDEDREKTRKATHSWPVEAVKWFRKAAEKGYPEAQHRLGFCYLSGDGVPKSFIEAYQFLDIAASHGEPNAEKARDDLETKMSAADISRAQKMATELQERIDSVKNMDEVAGGAGVSSGDASEFLLTIK